MGVGGFSQAAIETITFQSGQRRCQVNWGGAPPFIGPAIATWRWVDGALHLTIDLGANAARIGVLSEAMAHMRRAERVS